MRDDVAFERARLWFARANGWTRAAPGAFGHKTLARGGVNDGRYEWYRDSPPDHAEHYRKNRRAIAIVGHNYDGSGAGSGTHYGTEDITRFAERMGLVVHVAPAGKAASWYYPGACTLLVITRPGIEIVWPTPEQMAITKQAHDDEEARQKENARWLHNMEVIRKARRQAASATVIPMPLKDER